MRINVQLPHFLKAIAFAKNQPHADILWCPSTFSPCPQLTKRKRSLATPLAIGKSGPYSATFKYAPSIRIDNIFKFRTSAADKRQGHVVCTSLVTVRCSYLDP
jgi:hypothetical protein